MQETWKSFVYPLIEDRKQSIEEDPYHLHIENQLIPLGWAPWRDEIKHKPNLRIGNRNSIQPDILITCDGEEQFVIEVKRPNHIQLNEDVNQLESYMRQLKLKVGIYIGERLEIFYDKPDEKHVVSVLRIPLELEEKRGSRFVELFSKENFSKDEIIDFCEQRIREMQRQANLNKIREGLVADAQRQIAESLCPYLMEKYGNSFSEEDIKGMLATLSFTAKEKDNVETDVQVTIVPTQTVETETPNKRTYDSTTYSLNGSPMLGKNRLAYAIVSSYVKLHPKTTFEELERIFPPKLQGSFGVVRTLDYIKEKGYNGHRYFDKPDEMLKSYDGTTFVVSTQWGKGNLPNIIDVAIKLGFRIGTSSDADKKPLASIQDKVIKCFITRNSNATGLFNPTDQSLTVLRGSKVNPRHVDKINDANRKKRDKQLADYTKEVNGERIVIEDVVFDTPSGASKFCIGGSSNGWTEWKDEEHRELKYYRKDK